MYFRPKDGVAADVIPYYENGKYYIFYLKDYRGSTGKDEGISWNLLVSEDLVDFVDYGPVIKSGGANSQDYCVYTGSIFKHKDTYYAFYTGHNHLFVPLGKPQEVILRAKSKDLLHWKKDESFIIFAPKGYDQNDFRDPYVYFDEEEQCFKMLLAGRKTEGADPDRLGCTYLYRSDDLDTWTFDENLFYAPDSFFTHECPDLFKMGDWYYLIFSEFSDKLRTRYRMTKRLGDPWIRPKEDTFDCSCFYAAKTVSNGKERFLLGWNAIKMQDEDKGNWQWGGTIVAHKLTQDPFTGELLVSCPSQIADQYNVSESKTAPVLVKSEDCYQRVNISKLPEYCRIELCFTTGTTLKEFGLFFHADEKFTKGYLLNFHSLHNRMCFEHKRGIWNFKVYDVESERLCEIKPNTKYSMTVIREKSVLEVYFDGKIALSNRMYSSEEGMFGVYTMDSDVTFERVEIFK